MPWNVRIRPGSPGFAPSLRRTRADPDPEVLEVVAVLRTPDLRQELRVEDDLAGVGGEVLEEQPLGPRQLDELAAAPDHPPLQVDLDIVEGDDAGAGLDAGRAPDDRPDAGRQLVGVERLGDVVVGAEVEALRLVGGRALGREEDHRHRALLAELAHDLDPVEVRHDDVEEDDVGADLLGLGEGVLAAGRGDDPEALLAQRDGDELRDPGLVIGDEDQWLGSHRTPLLAAS